MKAVMMYEAGDGKQFRSEALCLEYEQQCTDLAAANSMLSNGATLMASLTRAHQTRPWWDADLSAEDKAILMKITKDTGFVVRSWQHILSPIYQPYELNHKGQVYLWGDIRKWDGSYGGWVSLPDLLRYAKDTEAEGACRCEHQPVKENQHE